MYNVGNAGVTQLIEYLVSTQDVEGLNPSTRSNFTSAPYGTDISLGSSELVNHGTFQTACRTIRLCKG